jgi:formylglycine-generating enzyme required for sulfatase activity
MSGNVWEWVEDCYSKDYSQSADCSLRVLRGGFWGDNAGVERVSNRDWDDPDDRGSDLGFRCSRDEN